jgi:hypothetical protein
VDESLHSRIARVRRLARLPLGDRFLARGPHPGCRGFGPYPKEAARLAAGRLDSPLPGRTAL